MVNSPILDVIYSALGISTWQKVTLIISFVFDIINFFLTNTDLTLNQPSFQYYKQNK